MAGGTPGGIGNDRSGAPAAGSVADADAQQRAVVESLRKLLRASVVEVIGTLGARDATLPEIVAHSPSVGEAQRARLRAVALDAMEGEGKSSDREITIEDLGWQAWVAPARSAAGELVGVVVIGRPAGDRWSDDEVTTIRACCELLGFAVARGMQEVSDRRQGHLDELVTRIAVHLMSGSRESFGEALRWTLQELVAFFGVDTVYFRRNDHDAGVSILVDEWPRRVDVPDPDPLGVVPFEGSDPVFAAIRDLDAPFVIRPESSPSGYQERVEQGSGMPEVSMAMVPLLAEAVTEGVLGFVNFSDRAWEPEEINALQAIAALLMQLQARVDAEEHLHYHARHDELTGLANRRALFAELDDRLGGPPGSSVAALFIDLDRFKGMNDVLGHGAGDRVLVVTADRLRTVLRPSDVAARVGGDEFVVVLGGPVTTLEAFVVAERLLAMIAQPVDLNGQHVNRTASVGVAVVEAGHATAHELLARADAALYAAKARGRNQIVIFDDDLRHDADDRFTMEIALRTAIDDAELEVFYQPEVDLRTGRLRALEALVRWHHPTRGLLAASAFITVAEDTGLIVDLGQWVLVEACRQLGAWLETYPGLDVALRVNLAPAQLMGRDLVPIVSEVLNLHAVPAARLSLEITEGAVMQDVERSIAVLSELRALGIDLAIDDFGTGQSSMAQLKRLPVGTLKIDQSFVAGVHTDRSDRAIVESIVRLARTFELDIVAEGVETIEQSKLLHKLGCDAAQGFLFAEAMPAEKIAPLLRREATLPRRARVDLHDWQATTSTT